MSTSQEQWARYLEQRAARTRVVARPLPMDKIIVMAAGYVIGLGMAYLMFVAHFPN
jgi:hypothetical protein